MLLGSMADESFSIIVVVPPRRPTFLNGTDPSQNLIVLNVNAQVLELWLTIGMVATLLERWLHYWNGGYTIGMVATLLKWWLHYWKGGYTIGMVAIIFLYKLISSSFVTIPQIPSHPIPHILHISKWKRERE